MLRKLHVYILLFLTHDNLSTLHTPKIAHVINSVINSAGTDTET